MIIIKGTLQVYHYCPRVHDYAVSEITARDIDFDETQTQVEVLCRECEQKHIIELKE